MVAANLLVVDHLCSRGCRNVLSPGQQLPACPLQPPTPCRYLFTNKLSGPLPGEWGAMTQMQDMCVV